MWNCWASFVFFNEQIGLGQLSLFGMMKIYVGISLYCNHRSSEPFMGPYFLPGCNKREVSLLAILVRVVSSVFSVPAPLVCSLSVWQHQIPLFGLVFIPSFCLGMVEPYSEIYF